MLFQGVPGKADVSVPRLRIQSGKPKGASAVSSPGFAARPGAHRRSHRPLAQPPPRERRCLFEGPFGSPLCSCASPGAHSGASVLGHPRIPPEAPAGRARAGAAVAPAWCDAGGWGSGTGAPRAERSPFVSPSPPREQNPGFVADRVSPSLLAGLLRRDNGFYLTPNKEQTNPN